MISEGGRHAESGRIGRDLTLPCALSSSGPAGNHESAISTSIRRGTHEAKHGPDHRFSRGHAAAAADDDVDARHSVRVAHVFDERNAAVQTFIARAIHDARRLGRKIGLCGQAPSDFPEFAQFLVEQGIDSISFNPDALLKGIENINMAEKVQQQASLVHERLL